MDVTAELDTSCPAERLFAEVDDLSRYPAWLNIVPRAVEEVASATGPAGADHAGGRSDDTGGPGADPAGEPGRGTGRRAWSVELRGRLGPLARSKRLRMVRTVHEPPTLARFERFELDGRKHSDWVLVAEVRPTAKGSRLVMQLHYGGSFGGGLLERMLRDEIERSRTRLQAIVES